VEFDFGVRVRVKESEWTRAVGLAGATGEVVGKSRADDETGPVVSYAVMIDSLQICSMVDPDEVELLY
jgi:hypothetical protein